MSCFLFLLPVSRFLPCGAARRRPRLSSPSLLPPTPCRELLLASTPCRWLCRAGEGRARSTANAWTRQARRVVLCIYSVFDDFFGQGTTTRFAVPHFPLSSFSSPSASVLWLVSSASYIAPHPHELFFFFSFSFFFVCHPRFALEPLSCAVIVSSLLPSTLFPSTLLSPVRSLSYLQSCPESCSTVHVFMHPRNCPQRRRVARAPPLATLHRHQRTNAPQIERQNERTNERTTERKNLLPSGTGNLKIKTPALAK